MTLPPTLSADSTLMWYTASQEHLLQLDTVATLQQTKTQTLEHKPAEKCRAIGRVIAMGST